MIPPSDSRTEAPVPALGSEVAKRIQWLEATRFIGAYIILSQHFTTLETPYFLPRGIGCNILWDHSVVPLFFLLSGLFVKPVDGWLNWKRFFKLLVPFVFWSAFAVVLTSNIHVDSLDWWRHAFGIRQGFMPFNKPLWFMGYLLVFSLLSPMYKRCPTRWQVALLVLMLLSSKFNKDAEWAGYFCAGMLLSHLPLQKICHFMERCYLPVFAVALCYPSAMLLIYGTGDSLLLSNALTDWLGIICLFSIGLFIWNHLPKVGRKFAQWGKFSFLLYAIHWPIEELLHKHLEGGPVWLGSLLPLAITAITIGIGTLLLRISPKPASLILMAYAPHRKQ